MRQQILASALAVISLCPPMRRRARRHGGENFNYKAGEISADFLE